MVSYRRSRLPRRRRISRRTTRTRVPRVVKKYVKKVMPRPEVKRELDGFSENIVTAGVTPYLQFEPLISQGTALNQRVGNEIRFLSIYAKVMLHNNSTLTQTVRMLVLGMASDTDTIPASMELFQDANVAGGTTTLLTSGTNFGNMIFKVNKKKFHVYYDRVFKLGSVNSVDGKNVVLIKKLFKIRSKIRYDGNTTGVGNQSKRYMILYLTSDPGLDNSGGAIEITGNHYYYFTDC